MPSVIVAIGLIVGLIATPIVSPARAAACVGDCGSDGVTTVDELLTMVYVALGNAPVEACAAGDANNDLSITVDEILTAASVAVDGCLVTPTPTSIPTTTATPLGGGSIVDVVPRAVTSTMQAIEILDFGFAAEQPPSGALVERVFRLRGMRRGDGGERLQPALRIIPETSCPGSAIASCSQTDTTSTRTVSYAGCTTITAAGHTLVRDGTISEEVGDPTFCDTRVFSPSTTVTLTLTNFTLTEKDEAGTELARVRADISDVSVPSGGGCGGAINGTETISGMQHVRCAPGTEAVTCPVGETDLTLVARSFALQRGLRSVGTDLCELTVLTDGNLDITNNLSGEHFAESFDRTQLTENPGPQGQTAFKIEGPLGLGCLGSSILLQTHAPLLMSAQGKCPIAGRLQVADPLPSAALAGHAKTNRRAETAPVVAAPTTTTGVSETNGFRQAVFRAAKGAVYQVLQNVNGDADLGADAFQVTTLAAGADGGAACYAASGAFDAEAVVGALQLLDSGLVVKSSRIQDTTLPCFDSQADAGKGAMCVGLGCTQTCACPPGANCTTFRLSTGLPFVQDTADIPAAAAVALPAAALGRACSGFAGAAAYRFGTGGPTLDVPSGCTAAPQDGFVLPRGTTVIIAYGAPLATRFTVGYGGFPIDIDGQNPLSCPSGSVLATGRAEALLTLPPPMMQFTNAGGVAFDLNQDGQVDSTIKTCADGTLVQCGVMSEPTPTPDPNAPPQDLGSALSASATGSTIGGIDGFGGATCGLAGISAPDRAFRFTAPTTGTYMIDTLDSDFDTILYVRDGNNSGLELACNDDASPGVAQSRVAVALTAEQQVVIVVDGYGDVSGHFVLHVTFTGSPPTPTPTMAAQLADLVVTSLQGPSVIDTGSVSATVSVTVRNQGGADAGAFHIDLRYLLSGASTRVDSGTVCTVAGLAAGDTTTCTQPIVKFYGTYTVSATVDPDNQVAESDETNNTREVDTGPIVIAPAAPSAEPASILLFPLVVNDGSRDTLIQITNTSNGAQNAVCFYVDGAGQFWIETDFTIALRGQQPTYWVASAGRAVDPADGQLGDDPGNVPPVAPGFTGELLCVTVATDGFPLPSNALVGSATITDRGSGDTAKYNAVGFLGDSTLGTSSRRLCLGNGPPDACPVPSQYAGCPAQWTVDHIADGAPIPQVGAASSVRTYVTIVPCTQDFENLRPGSTQVSFVVTNEFEQQFTATTTVECWLDTPLSDISDIFGAPVLGSYSARTTVAPTSAADPGIVVLAHEIRSTGGATPVITSAAVNASATGTRSTIDQITLPNPGF